jgi:TRAP-type C4-dicarboxylate transport system permease large subunit
MAGSTVSVGGMFMAGIVPGLLIALGFMALCSLIAWRKRYPPTGESFRIANVLHQLRRSFIIFMMPVLVIGGIISSTRLTLLVLPALYRMFHREGDLKQEEDLNLETMESSHARPSAH